MHTVIIKYNAGNIRSVDFALGRLGVEAEITDNADKIRNADKVIFPGVGEARSTMDHLRENGLDRVIASLQQPVLGICLGMQLLCAETEERNTRTLGIIPTQVERFRGTVKVPHMGWNRINRLQSPLFEGIEEGSFVYFVHSYYVPLMPQVIAESGHGTRFTAAVRKDNFYAVQFHPEKSGPTGAKILSNFMKI
ncbi:MAG TPA: imidazole glycerol phosphate synthase subunit HisH [Bacteroidales bacterium]|nr:imidazole glycerol phosphate synthase subunit HisH [Bacteroidales bacterium]